MAVVTIGRLKTVSVSMTALMRRTNIEHVVKKSKPVNHQWVEARVAELGVKVLLVHAACGLEFHGTLDIAALGKPTRPCDRCTKTSTGIMTYQLEPRASLASGWLVVSGEEAERFRQWTENLVDTYGMPD